MWRRVLQTQKEGTRRFRAFPAIGDELNRTFRQHLCGVADSFDGNFSLIEIRIAGHVFVCKEVGCPAHDSKELVEATLHWSEVW